MAPPEPLVVVSVADAAGDRIEQRSEQVQREPVPGAGVGAWQLVEACLAEGASARAVPVEDLQDQQLDGHHRPEDAVSEAVAHACGGQED